jgi:hypothetical protein
MGDSFCALTAVMDEAHKKTKENAYSTREMMLVL